MLKRISPLLLLLAATLAVAMELAAAPAAVAKLVVSGLSRPVDIVAAGDGNARLFVVEQTGHVRIVEGRTLLPAPFLDMTTLISTGNERGLLGLAFHPDYAVNRAFYVFYTALDGALTVARYLRDPRDPRLADPGSGVVVLSVPHGNFANHNGGKLAFGPDGYLYISTGDGGGGDPGQNAQNLATLLGKLLRIAVDGGAGYAIPPDNPHAGNAKCPGTGLPCPEIWAYGLRNPWRFSFDRTSGDIFIGDVGQNAWEEIDYLRAGSAGGANFGWRVFEGSHCFDPPVGCTLADMVPPVIEYPHDAASGGFAVTGGFRYRGLRNTSLRGHYLYSDFASRRMWTVVPAVGAPWSPRVMIEPAEAFGGVAAFGEDHAGELYMATVNTGQIWTFEAPLAASPLQLRNGSLTSYSIFLA